MLRKCAGFFLPEASWPGGDQLIMEREKLFGVEEVAWKKSCQSASNHVAEMFSAQEYYAMFWVYPPNNGDASAAA